MDQGVKILAAVGVLMGGIVVALMFRHESLPNRPAVPTHPGPLLLHKDRGTMPFAPGAAEEPPDETDPTPMSAAPDASRPATVVSPGVFTEPPCLTREYPGLRVPETPRWGSQGNIMPAANAPRTHKIVDGDTLEALAERYLGSADRYREIYEANRDVLPSPELLPIGTKLKIPPPGIKALRGPNMMPKRRLVPLRAQ